MADYADKIAPKLGISVAEAQRFMGAAQVYAGSNLSYREIYEYLGNGRWSAGEIQQMADAQGITLNPLRQAVLGTAHILGITTAEAEDFIREVDDHFPEPVDAADVWAAVQAVDPAHLTKRAIIAAVEPSVIAHKMGIALAEAQELAAVIGELVGLSISNQEILDTLRAAAIPLTIDTLLDQLVEKSRPIVALAAEIDDTPEEAQYFARDVRKSYPWATDHDILDAVRLLAQPNRKVQAIYDSLETLRIGRALNIDPGLVAVLPRRIAEETGYPLTRADLLAAITQAGDEDERLTAVNLPSVCEVARDRNMTLLAAARFVNDVRRQVEFPVTNAEFRRAFAATRAPKSKTRVVATLQTNWETRSLGLDLDDLMAEIDRTLHLDIGREQLLEIIHHLGPDVTTDQIIAHIREKFATILFIAEQLAIEPAAVGKAVGELQQQCGWRIEDVDVAKALRLIPGQTNSLDLILVELEGERLAEVLEIGRAEARRFPATIFGSERRPVTYHRVLEALTVLDPAQQDIDNVTALIRLADALEMSFEDVLRLKGRVERDLGDPVSLTLLGQIARQIDAPGQNIEALIDYLKLDQMLVTPQGDPKIIARTVNFLGQNKPLAPRFWALMSKFQRQGQLSAHDLDYIRQLTDWPALSLISAPFGGQDWLTFYGLEQVLSGETRHTFGRSREGQIRGLNNLSGQCWRQICSTERRYQIPSRGRAEILAPEELRTRLGLRSLRFFQEGVSAPGVFVGFQFENPDAVGLVRFAPDGRLEGFHQLVDSSWFAALVEAVALSFYRDLVIAVNILLPPQPRNPTHAHPINKRGHSQPTPRNIPTRRPVGQVGRPEKRVHSLTDWYRSQEIARHLVRGHTRFISHGFIAAPEKQAQARRAGVTLRKGDTWVIEHERGDPQYHMPIELDGIDLTAHTLFAPPQKAAKELQDLLR